MYKRSLVCVIVGLVFELNAVSKKECISEKIVKKAIRDGKGTFGMRYYLGNDRKISFAWLGDSNDIQNIQLALENGENINDQDAHGNTALTNAARRGYLDVVTYLIAHGATLEKC